MRIWPAIDLRGGKCVRLQQGDYDRETVFGDDPAEIATRWVSQGADCLHLVDLDGARDGVLVNGAAIDAIVSAVDVPCQIGGGIRNESTVESLLDIGLDRLVVGTKAVTDADWFRNMCRKFPLKLVLGIDARNGQVATDGWLATTSLSAIDAAKQFAGEPIAAIVYTDIARDGMLTGPNLPAMSEMKNAAAIPVVASGGVSSKKDIQDLAQLGMDGCIVGRALYEGQVRLPEIIDAAQGKAARGNNVK